MRNLFAVSCAVLLACPLGSSRLLAVEPSAIEDAHRYRQLGEQLAQEGRYQEAAEILRQAALLAQGQTPRRALARDPRNRAAQRLAKKHRLMVQALASERAGNLRQATVLWRKAQSADPDDPQIRAALTGLQKRTASVKPRVQRAAEFSLLPYKPLVEEYLVSVGDVLEVFVWQQPDLSRDVIIRPDGRLSFPLVGDVDAAGMTLVQLDQIITTRLKAYVRFPDVSLAIKRFGGTKTIVLGEVSSPGIYIPSGEGRVLDVIAMAGGFKAHAVKDTVMLIRGGMTQPQIAKLDLDAALSRGRLEENVRLQADDIVFVPERKVNTVLEFMEDFYPTIGELLVGQSIATGFGTDVRIQKSDRPRTSAK